MGSNCMKSERSSTTNIYWTNRVVGTGRLSRRRTSRRWPSSISRTSRTSIRRRRSRRGRTVIRKRTQMGHRCVEYIISVQMFRKHFCKLIFFYCLLPNNKHGATSRSRLEAMAILSKYINKLEQVFSTRKTLTKNNSCFRQWVSNRMLEVAFSKLPQFFEVTKINSYLLDAIKAEKLFN